ncbi:surface carbohydrate biosynthesis protein [Thermaurantiacus sp.]
MTAAQVALIVDNPLRDLDGLVLVAFELAGRGYRSVLVPMYDQAYDIEAADASVVVLNYLRSNNLDLVARWQAQGRRIIVLDSEGNAGKTADDYARLVSAAGALDLVDGYCVWGKAQHRAFAERALLAPERLFLTGCPRYDFCAPPLRPALPGSRERAGYLLVNTNFCAASPRFSSGPEAEVEAMVRAGVARDLAVAVAKDAAMAQRGMVELIAELARRLPELRTVVRPHPFERHEPYAALRQLGTVKVDASGTSLEWIAPAAALLHLNCSTAIEAVMLGCEPMSPGFLDTPAIHVPGPAAVSRFADSTEDTIALVAAAVASTLPPPPPDLRARRETILTEIYFRIDGRASARVSDVVEAVLARPARAPVRRPSPRGRIVAAARSVLGPAVFEQVRAPLVGLSDARRAAKAIDRARVAELAKRLASLRGLAPPSISPLTASGATGRSLVLEPIGRRC